MLIVSLCYPNIFSGIKYTFNNIIYFYIGFLISRNEKNSGKILTFLKNVKVMMLLIGSFLIIFMLFYINNLFKMGTTYSSKVNVPIKMVGIFTLISISLIIERRFRNRFYYYFDKYGKLTLIIYLVHRPVGAIFRIILNKFVSLSVINVILFYISIIMVSWICSVFVCYLARKFKFINIIFYPRKNYVSKYLKKTHLGQYLFRN